MKNKGQFQISEKLLKDALGIPDECAIIHLSWDPTRSIVSGILLSENPVYTNDGNIGWTFPTPEAIEPRHVNGDFGEINPVHMAIHERVRNKLLGTEPIEEDTE